MQVGAMMLGYAIESTLKHSLSEKNCREHSILFSHDLPLLFQACQKIGLFCDVEVSPDLIEYANDLFDVRYPSQLRAKSEDVLKRGRAMGMTPAFLIPYDDLLIKLDTSLWDFTGDHRSSAAIIAARSSNSFDGRLFFHCNAPAVLMRDRYLEVVRKHYPTNDGDIATLEKGAQHLYYFDETHIRFAPLEVVGVAQPAKNFRYPGRVVQDSDGNIIDFRDTSDFLKGP
jgi:hypothetical protein